jgi:hypothetical protein
MNAIKIIKQHLRPGQVYRRAEIMRWSKAVDRNLKQMLEKGLLNKLSGGLYYCPKETIFGNAPAEEHSLISAFLKDNRFLITSPNSYNSLGIGATQLYNETIVYNHKRHGHFKLGGRTFIFRMKHHFPKKTTKEFLLVDLVNNLDSLAEDRNSLLAMVKQKVSSLNTNKLIKAIAEYGNLKSRKFFATVISN